MLLQPQALSSNRQAAAARIDTRLLPPATQNLAEPLLKNTLAEETAPPPDPPAEPARAAAQSLASSSSPASAKPRASSASSAARQTAQRKLAAHIYYPEEAVARGLEGEVRLLLTLAPDGRLLDAVIAASSGHALLDQAALDAVRTMGGLPDAGVVELILPVVFRLQ
ncbi:hypothetical protein ACY05_02350 [Sterolibacterium denitrificans]|uniref:TonB C-terminal domain-containing protein n=1 Tax=Sterolibacterium denitrificans TaxID=157592 RepID=A0A656Z9E1_9PROT|nr:hypothetical protein ACY05_02350 [Sterolibacterium denitrificans]